MVLFDTSILVDAARKNKAALDLIESYAGKEKIATTTITKYEMLRGATNQDIDFITQLLDKFVIYDFEDAVVDQVVETYKMLAKKGKLVNELDIIIAGIALAHDETLVTKDKDFWNFESNKIIVLS